VSKRILQFSETIEANPQSVDKFIFSGGLLLLVVIVGSILIAPQWSAMAIERFYVFITTRMGVFYVIAAILTLGFLLFIAISSHGDLVLGPDDGPEYGRYSWASMLFCAGIAASLIYWGATEWTFYYIAPPFGIEPESDAALLMANSYGMFHWGPIGWAFYCLPAVGLCLSYHVCKIPELRLSSACREVLGKQQELWPGRLVDLLFIVGTIGTCATGLGFGTSVVSAALNKLTGIEDGFSLQLGVILAATGLIAFSVYKGLNDGIRRLSTINSVLALILIAYILLIGPTLFILEAGVTSIGTVTTNFLRMLTWTDPLQRADFVESRTVFYWAWWLAMGPFVGMFICKISHGRSLRELILGVLGWGSLGCALFFMVLGGYAQYLEVYGLYPVVAEATEISPATAIASIVSLLPFGSVLVLLVAVIGLVFVATTYDSAAYTLAAGATRYLSEDEHPPRWHRVFWAFALGTLPLSLLFLGGLRELQSASLLASLPLLFVYGILGVSIWRMLRCAEA
jgi:BCCT family betaine/carnitine transporter